MATEMSMVNNILPTGGAHHTHNNYIHFFLATIIWFPIIATNVPTVRSLQLTVPCSWP